MYKYLGRFSLCCLLIATTSLAGCNILNKNGIGTTPIQKVLKMPSDTQQVTIHGKVTDQIAILGKGVYQLTDETGSIWILTDKGTPGMNQNIAVTGHLEKGFVFAGKNFGLSLVEQTRID